MTKKQAPQLVALAVIAALAIGAIVSFWFRADWTEQLAENVPSSSPKRQIPSRTRLPVVSRSSQMRIAPSPDAAAPQLEGKPQDAGVEPLPAVNHEARLEDFREECWRSTGAQYDAEWLDTFSIHVPTAAVYSVDFDFCIQAVFFGDDRVLWDADGRVSSKDNPAIGLNGSWYAHGDNFTQWRTSDGKQGFSQGARYGAPICISGSASPVKNRNYGAHWGASVSLKLYEKAGQAGLLKPTFDKLNVALTGKQIPRKLHLVLGGGGRDWCTSVITTQETLRPTGSN